MKTQKPFEVGKTYKTLGGHSARVVSVDRNHPQSVVYLFDYNNKGEDYIGAVHPNGKTFSNGMTHYLDLIPEYHEPDVTVDYRNVLVSPSGRTTVFGDTVFGSAEVATRYRQTCIKYAGVLKTTYIDGKISSVEYTPDET